MGWGLRLNGLGPGAKWDTPWGKMGCALWLNVLGPRLNGLGLGLNGWYHGAKWDMPWNKMGYTLGQNGMCPGAKYVGA